MDLSPILLPPEPPSVQKLDMALDNELIGEARPALDKGVRVYEAEVVIVNRAVGTMLSHEVRTLGDCVLVCPGFWW